MTTTRDQIRKLNVKDMTEGLTTDEVSTRERLLDLAADEDWRLDRSSIESIEWQNAEIEAGIEL